MKIIMAPSKEMDWSHPEEIDWHLSKKSQIIQETLLEMNKDELQKSLKLKDKQLLEVLTYRDTWALPFSSRARDLYKGVAFRSLHLTNLSEEEEGYLNDHLRILSAFYGVLQPNDRVKPYRLDFILPLKIQGKSLKTFWGKSWDQSFEEGEWLINLASKEFASRLTASRYHWLDIDFAERVGDRLIRPSSLVKKARGMMANYLIHHQLTDLERIKQFKEEGYHFVEEESNDQLLTFIREKE
ncbi:YaaA family protein [Atopobacter sp. AH10]|uniref:YaaA family protein n=1 Tax=Atopobacter sp. AH10 TaxID=2315861 RepID=UPI000EF1CA66|nr:peroxide stress protein YaaA [Atopobacter sp. AH10]RLK63422.1 YaaA family protein [Atopobacter sp. AH10]